MADAEKLSYGELITGNFPVRNVGTYSLRSIGNSDEIITPAGIRCFGREFRYNCSYQETDCFSLYVVLKYQMVKFRGGKRGHPFDFLVAMALEEGRLREILEGRQDNHFLFIQSTSTSSKKSRYKAACKLQIGSPIDDMIRVLDKYYIKV